MTKRLPKILQHTKIEDNEEEYLMAITLDSL